MVYDINYELDLAWCSVLCVTTHHRDQKKLSGRLGKLWWIMQVVANASDDPCQVLFVVVSVLWHVPCNGQHDLDLSSAWSIFSRTDPIPNAQSINIYRQFVIHKLHILYSCSIVRLMFTKLYDVITRQLTPKSHAPFFDITSNFKEMLSNWMFNLLLRPELVNCTIYRQAVVRYYFHHWQINFNTMKSWVWLILKGFFGKENIKWQ